VLKHNYSLLDKSHILSSTTLLEIVSASPQSLQYIFYSKGTKWQRNIPTCSLYELIMAQSGVLLS
jgi:hypothetical protein